jgi:thimet oligopeptidase
LSGRWCPTKKRFTWWVRTDLFREKPGPSANGTIHITTDYPDLFPGLTYARSDNLRRRLFIAFFTRAYPKNRDVLLDMMQTRFEIATLLGYSSWADYNAADKMIGNGKNIGGFIQQLDVTTRPIAEREDAMLLAERRKTTPEAKDLSMADYWYSRELVRRSQYDFDSQSVRPYLAYDKVRQGILETAQPCFTSPSARKVAFLPGRLPLRPGM